jgi:hypothetical protein
MKKLTIQDLNLGLTQRMSKYNFLLKPIDCECGCGGNMSIVLENEEDVFGLMFNILSDEECGMIGAFAIQDKGFVGMLKIDEEYTTIKGKDYMEIYKLCNDLELHCLAIWQKDSDTTYRLITDKKK